MQFEADDRRRAHLDRGDAHLAVALREMPVAGREETALLEDGEKQI